MGTTLLKLLVAGFAWGFCVEASESEEPAINTGSDMQSQTNQVVAIPVFVTQTVLVEPVYWWQPSYWWRHWFWHQHHHRYWWHHRLSWHHWYAWHHGDGWEHRLGRDHRVAWHRSLPSYRRVLGHSAAALRAPHALQTFRGFSAGVAARVPLPRRTGPLPRAHPVPIPVVPAPMLHKTPNWVPHALPAPPRTPEPHLAPIPRQPYQSPMPHEVPPRARVPDRPPTPPQVPSRPHQVPVPHPAPMPHPAPSHPVRPAPAPHSSRPVHRHAQFIPVQAGICWRSV